MHGDFGLLINLSVSLVLALVLGLITQRLRLSPIVGYLLAGVALGPQTPGFVADPKMAAELAEIGVVLLMFGVGMHFDLRDLLAVRRIALPGAGGQILVATALGLLAALLAGLGVGAGLVIGVRRLRGQHGRPDPRAHGQRRAPHDAGPHTFLA